VTSRAGARGFTAFERPPVKGRQRAIVELQRRAAAWKPDGRPRRIASDSFRRELAGTLAALD
jgi:hypothetical protein